MKLIKNNIIIFIQLLFFALIFAPFDINISNSSFELDLAAQ